MQNIVTNIHSKIQGQLHAWLSFILLSSVIAPVQAEYQDPIDLPAVMTASTPQSLQLDLALAGPRIVSVGERGYILYSDDQAKTWTQAQVASSNHLNAVYFADEKHGWAVGEDAIILHSKDAGETWIRQFDDRDADLKGPLLDVYFTDTQNGFAVGVFNKFLHTKDGGESWNNWQAHIDNEDEWHLFAITGTDKGHIYAASEMGLVFRSQDAGQTFEPMQSDHYGSFHGVMARTATDGDQLALFGVGGILYTSNDSGESWREENTNTQIGLAQGTWQKDGSALIAGAGILLRSNTELGQWAPSMQANGLPLASIITIDNTIIATGLGGIQVITPALTASSANSN